MQAGSLQQLAFPSPGPWAPRELKAGWAPSYSASKTTYNYYQVGTEITGKMRISVNQ